MKSPIIFLLCIALNFTSFAQNNHSNESIKETYLHKSKVNNRTANILLATGGALLITGGIIDIVKRPELLAGFTYEFFGVTSVLVSGPFFLSAFKNKKKALNFSLNTHKNLLVHPDIVLKSIQPTVTYIISL